MTTDKLDAADRIIRAIAAARKRYQEENPTGVFTEKKASEVVRAQLAIEFPKPANTKRVNGRDQIFDAIANACGIDLTCLGRRQAATVATAKAEILEASPDVTPEQIDRRAAAYRAKYKEAACTPMALVLHWAEFGNAQGRRTASGKTDIYQEPENWQERILRVGLPGISRDALSNLTSKPWDEIRVNWGVAIIQRLEPRKETTHAEEAPDVRSRQYVD